MDRGAQHLILADLLAMDEPVATEAATAKPARLAQLLHQSQGMGGKPGGIVTRNLGKILEKLDPGIKQDRAPLKGHENKEPPTIFRLTPKAKEEISKGQRLFSGGGIPVPAYSKED